LSISYSHFTAFNTMRLSHNFRFKSGKGAVKRG
jgi:hypothetical protein